jgi:SAM-dependent methyltransferase
MPAPFRRQAGILRRIADHLLFPVNMWLSEEASHRFGLTPIDHERVRAALPHCQGRLLDIGCGNNLLVRTHGNGIGIDVHRYPETQALADSAALPFRDGAFESIALLACLNHITRRSETLSECHRVLQAGGRVLISMIHPWIGFFSHPIRHRHDPDQLERGLGDEEQLGLTRQEIMKLLRDAGFQITCTVGFLWGLNHLYVAEKKPQRHEGAEAG